MLILLRCQVHMEIARIEEDGDRLEAALEHLQKAMHLNSSGQYQEHLRLSFNRLRLSAMLYEAPEHLEDQALMLIEQVSMRTKSVPGTGLLIKFQQRRDSCLVELLISRASISLFSASCLCFVALKWWCCFTV